VPYVSVDEFKAWARLDVGDTVDDVEVAAVLLAAERSVDAHCGRQFARLVTGTQTATQRTFTPRTNTLLDVHDFWTDSGLVVESRVSVDSAWVTWAAADYQAEPLNGVRDGVAGWPSFRLRAVRARWFPMWKGGATVRVTAKWGWAAVPDEVQLATLMQASRWLKRRESPAGLLEFMGDGAAVRVSPLDGDVLRLLQPYVVAERVIGVG
jgi:hypothetical protein